MNLLIKELALKSKDLTNSMEEKEMMINAESTLKIKMNILESKYCEEKNTLELELETLRLEISNASRKNEKLNKATLVMQKQISTYAN